MDSVAFVVKTVLMYLSYILLGLSVAMVTYSYFRAYRDSPDGKVTPSEVWQIMVRRIGAVLGASLLLIVAFALLSGLFVVAADLLGGAGAFLIFLMLFPLIYFIVVLLLYLPVVIIEGTGVIPAFRRCFELIKSKWWSTFGLYFVTAFVGQIVAFVFILPVYIAMGVSTFFTVRDGTESLTENNPFGWYGALLAVAVLVGYIFSQTIIQTAMSFQYFNLVERSEGKGLMDKIENLGDEKKEDEGSY